MPMIGGLADWMGGLGSSRGRIPRRTRGGDTERFGGERTSEDRKK